MSRDSSRLRRGCQTMQVACRRVTDSCDLRPGIMLVTTYASTAPLTIDIRPARMDDIYPILGLHREAFAEKFGAAFGARGTARGIEAMAEAWRRQGMSALRGMLVASADDHVI